MISESFTRLGYKIESIGVTDLDSLIIDDKLALSTVDGIGKSQQQNTGSVDN